MPDSIVLSSHFGGESDSARFQPSLAGIKAVGLSRLPTHWTPHFFVISAPASASLFDTQFGLPRSAEPLEVEASDALKLLRQAGFQSVIVRSSSAAETLADRGLYESKVCLSATITLPLERQLEFPVENQRRAAPPFVKRSAAERNKRGGRTPPRVALANLRPRRAAWFAWPRPTGSSGCSTPRSRCDAPGGRLPPLSSSDP